MYYLHHYFDPDFSHIKLTPEEGADGVINQRYLGYVQNVVAGQVLAELIDLDEFPEISRDHRFTYKEQYLPYGPNCGLHPNNPNKIIALANGYCFYHNGLICVKKLLNVRGNVGFHTGSIYFVNDISIYGDVQTGFTVHGKNVLVKGHIESAKVKAAGDLICIAGVRGSNLSAVPDMPTAEADDIVPDTLVDAGRTVRLPFCEHAQIRARGNLIIDGHCLHSTVYVGGNLIIKGRLQGGAVYANNIVYVEGRLGSDYSSPTSVFMGYDPFDYLALQKLENQLHYLKTKMAYFEQQAARSNVLEQEFIPRLELVRRKLKILHMRRNLLWQKFSVDEKHAVSCRLLVPGRVMPGVEISIARAYMRTDYPDRDVAFMLGDDEILIRRPAFLQKDEGAP